MVIFPMPPDFQFKDHPPPPPPLALGFLKSHLQYGMDIFWNQETIFVKKFNGVSSGRFMLLESFKIINTMSDNGVASPQTSVGVRLSRIHFFANNGEGEVEGMKTNNLSATELI